MAKLHDDRQTSHATQCLANLLRQNLERTGSLCPLIDEIRYIRLYLEMYQIMYPQQLQFVICHDPDLDDIAVPVFLLQPIVENAIVHGIGPKSGRGCIRIMTELNDDRLIVCVADDGCGIPAERLANIWEHQPEGAQMRRASACSTCGSACASSMARTAGSSCCPKRGRAPPAGSACRSEKGAAHVEDRNF